MLSKADETSSSCDLILYLIDVYKKSGTSVSEGKGLLVQLINQIDSGKETQMKQIANEAIQWAIQSQKELATSTSSANSKASLEAAELHHIFGAKFAKESCEFYEAERHLLLGTKESPKVLAQMLFTWAVEPGLAEDKVSASQKKVLIDNKNRHQVEEALVLKETPETIVSNLGIYVSRGVLPYLTEGNIYGARAVLTEFINLVNQNRFLTKYTKFVEHSVIDTQLYIFENIPLLNFLQLLILTCQTQSKDLYLRLKTRYKSILDELAAWDPALTKIEASYFGIQPPAAQGNMFNMLGSLMGSGGF